MFSHDFIQDTEEVLMRYIFKDTLITLTYKTEKLKHNKKFSMAGQEKIPADQDGEMLHIH